MLKVSVKSYEDVLNANKSLNESFNKLKSIQEFLINHDNAINASKANLEKLVDTFTEQEQKLKVDQDIFAQFEISLKKITETIQDCRKNSQEVLDLIEKANNVKYIFVYFFISLNLKDFL